MPQARILVIFDGSNFYHKAKKLTPEIHLTHFNYRKLAEHLASGASVGIEYCVGEVRPPTLRDDKSRAMYAKQQALFYHLQEQKVIIKKGFLLQSQGVYHEKGVDVRIATDIVRGALKNEFDACYCISSDSDLVPAIETARGAGKTMVYDAFEGMAVSRALVIHCFKTIFITKDFSKIDVPNKWSFFWVFKKFFNFF